LALPEILWLVAHNLEQQLTMLIFVAILCYHPGEAISVIINRILAFAQPPHGCAAVRATGLTHDEVKHAAALVHLVIKPSPAAEIDSA
jgi:hypothetical protein